MTSLLLLALGASPVNEWRALGKGIEYRTFTLDENAAIADGLLHVVRVDPAVATLDVGLASLDGSDKRTAAEWAEAKGFAVTMNAGMFDLEDHRSNVGHLQHGAHVNQAAWKGTYQSVLVFGPREKGVAAARILDRDAPGFSKAVGQYATVIQNLRLMKARGESVWKPNKRKWSEALIAEDAQGRLLFIFTRTPYEMAELNARLARLPLGIERAFHAEGGPEASLSIRAPGLELDLCGSWETGFNEDDLNPRQWPVPNVIGVR